MKNRNLCYYDYGQGAIWCYILAESAEEIYNKYPELKVVNGPPPSWFNEEVEKKLRENMTFDIEDKPKNFLVGLLKTRND